MRCEFNIQIECYKPGSIEVCRECPEYEKFVEEYAKKVSMISTT